MNAPRSYRDLLFEEYEKRCEANSRYSLRAFSRDLNINSSRLSEVLNGKCGLSRSKAQVLCQRLNFSQQKTERFCDLVDSIHARSLSKRTAAQQRLSQGANSLNTPLAQDTFALISRWYHYALLELTTVKGFQDEAKWIAKALSISETEAQSARERLLRMGLLHIKSGKLKPTHTSTRTTDGVPSDSIKKYQSQIIDKAKQALTLQDLKTRNISSITFSFQKKNLEKATKRIQAFRHELARDFAAPKTGDAVYALSIQFFSLTPELNPTQKGSRS